MTEESTVTEEMPEAGEVAPEAPPEATFVEPHLGLEEFLGTAPQLRTASPALRAAITAALTRWMRQNSMDMAGHYAYADWQGYYSNMLRHS